MDHISDEQTFEWTLTGMDLLAVEKAIQNACEQKRKIVNLSHREITVLPSSIQRLSSTTHLHLNNNRYAMGTKTVHYCKATIKATKKMLNNPNSSEQ